MADEPLESDAVHAYLREWIGQTIGGFALDESAVTESDLIEAVTCELMLTAATVDEVFGPATPRIAELFCTP